MKKLLLSLSLVGLISNTCKFAIATPDPKSMIPPVTFSPHLFGKIYPSLSPGIINASILAGAAVGIGIARYIGIARFEERQRTQHRNHLRRNYLIKKYNLEKKTPDINGLQAQAERQVDEIARYEKELQDQVNYLSQEVSMYDRVLYDITQLQKYDTRDQKKIKADILRLSKTPLLSAGPLKVKARYWSDIIRTYSFGAWDYISQECTRVRLEKLIRSNQGHITQEDLDALAQHVKFNRDTKKNMLMKFTTQPSLEATQHGNEQKLLGGDLSKEYVRQSILSDHAHGSNKAKDEYKSILTAYAITPD